MMETVPDTSGQAVPVSPLLRTLLHAFAAFPAPDVRLHDVRVYCSPGRDAVVVVVWTEPCDGRRRWASSAVPLPGLALHQRAAGLAQVLERFPLPAMLARLFDPDTVSAQVAHAAMLAALPALRADLEARQRIERAAGELRRLGCDVRIPASALSAYYATLPEPGEALPC